MNQDKQPEALRLAEIVDTKQLTICEAYDICAELRRQHTRITELEAELAALEAVSQYAHTDNAPVGFTENEKSAWSIGYEEGIAASKAAPSQTTSEDSIKEVMGLINKLVTAEFISEYSGSEEEDIEAEVLIIKCRKVIESKLRELLESSVKWVKCADALPEIDEVVLIAVPGYGEPIEAWLAKGGKTLDGLVVAPYFTDGEPIQSFDGEPTHWARKPSLPK